MIDFSDKSYLKIRWNPNYKPWFNQYIYYSEEAPGGGFRGFSAIGYKQGFEISYGLASCESWIDTVSSVTHLSTETVSNFGEWGAELWDKYKLYENAKFGFPEDRHKSTEDSYYQQDEAKIKNIRKECHDRFIKMRSELTSLYERVIKEKKNDVKYFGSEAIYKKIDPEVINLRHLQLALLREIRRSREECSGKTHV